MKYRNAPLHRRVAEFKLALQYSNLEGYFASMADYFGKDAVMKGIMQELGLGERSDHERMAESVYNLVPGEIRQVIHTPSMHTTVIPDIYHESWDNLKLQVKMKHITLERWQFRGTFAYDRDTHTLFIHEGDDA